MSRPTTYATERYNVFPSLLTVTHAEVVRTFVLDTAMATRKACLPTHSYTVQLVIRIMYDIGIHLMLLRFGLYGCLQNVYDFLRCSP